MHSTLLWFQLNKIVSHIICTMSFIIKEKCTMQGQFFHDKLAGARGTELPPPPFQLSVYIFIFNKISLLFHLFFLNLGIVCIYPYNLMVTTTCIYWPFFPYNNTYILLNRKLIKWG